MKLIVFICLLFSGSAICSQKIVDHNDFITMHKNLSISNYSDTSKNIEFKKFVDTFFVSIKKGDTIYLKKHIVFPISNSSFPILVESLNKYKSINSNTLFRNLKKLFPNDIIDKIPTGEYAISEHQGFETKYIVAIYESSQEIESNYSWLFVFRHGIFYFTNFFIEAG